MRSTEIQAQTGLDSHVCRWQLLNIVFRIEPAAALLFVLGELPSVAVVALRG